MNNFYLEWEDELIRAQRLNAKAVPLLMSLLPGRTSSSIKSRAGYLGVLFKQPAVDWTCREDAVIRRRYPNYEQAARLLPNRTLAAIHTRAVLLGLGRGQKKRWSPAAEAILIKLHPIHTIKEIACIMNRGKSSVGGKCFQLGLNSKSSVVKPASPVIEDLMTEARRRGLRINKITRALGFQVIKRQRRNQMPSIVASVSALGGVFYAEWND